MTTWLKTLALVAALVFPTAALAEPAATPTLRVDTLDGPLFDLAEQRGKWVIVNFWATWCSPCIKEMPDISDYVASHPQVTAIGLAYEDIARILRIPVGTVKSRIFNALAVLKETFHENDA